MFTVLPKWNFLAMLVDINLVEEILVVRFSYGHRADFIFLQWAHYVAI